MSLVKSRQHRTPQLGRTDTGAGETMKSKVQVPCKHVSLPSLLVQLGSAPNRHVLNKASGTDEGWTQILAVSLPLCHSGLAETRPPHEAKLGLSHQSL